MVEKATRKTCPKITRNSKTNWSYGNYKIINVNICQIMKTTTWNCILLNALFIVNKRRKRRQNANLQTDPMVESSTSSRLAFDDVFLLFFRSDTEQQSLKSGKITNWNFEFSVKNLVKMKLVLHCVALM